jgi:CubicO group peptidase (beta-lactamase class C family)
MKNIVVSIFGVLIALVAWAGLVLAATLNGCLHAPLAGQSTTQSFREATIRTLHGQFVGNFAMGVMHNGVMEYELFHSAGKRVDRNTVFQVSSLSKWISAFGVMALVADGRLALDTPVSRYLHRWQLPPSTFDHELVTVRRLLSHTAGLTDGLGYDGFEPGTPVQSLEQSLTHAADADNGVDGSVHIGLAPGSAFQYSGGGYTLLQLLVEEVSGKSFDIYMRDAVFEPLGMSHSSYCWGDSSERVLAEFYKADGTRAEHCRYTALAAVSLYTSLADLELFFQAHMPGRHGESIGRGIISPAYVRMMREPHARQMGVDIWGLGTVLYAPTEDYDFIIGHDGKSTPPINTAVRLNPRTGDGIIILETGSPLLATTLASEWVFWKTGQVDTFLFPMLLPKAVLLAGIGWVIILAGAVIWGFVRRARLRWHFCL